jgi:hypothetical protein
MLDPNPVKGRRIWNKAHLEQGASGTRRIWNKAHLEQGLPTAAVQ